jgi:hypothetical protein
MDRFKDSRLDSWNRRVCISVEGKKNSAGDDGFYRMSSSSE